MKPVTRPLAENAAVAVNPEIHRDVDIRVRNEGSLFLFEAHTLAAKEWINLHIPADATFWCGSLVVEPRYARDLATGMQEDGLVLE
jgi:hypothetical protein